MKGDSWVALLTAGCFSVLASFSIGAFHPDAKAEESQFGAFVEGKLAGYEPRTAEVTLWKAGDSIDTIQKAKASGLDVVDRVAVTGERKREECGEDFACLLAWAEAKR